MRFALALTLCTTLAASSAHALILVLPPRVEGFSGNTQQIQIDKALEPVISKPMRASPQGPVDPGCEIKPECLRKLADAVGADEIAFIKLRRVDTGAFAEVEVSVFDADGKAQLTLTRELSVRAPDRELQALFVQAFRPSAYAGSLAATGVAPDEELVVDGLPITGGLEHISVGEHVVGARTKDGRIRMTKPVVIAYDEQSQVDLTPAPVGDGARPVWPFVVALVVAGAGTALVPTTIGFALYDSVAADRYRSQAQTVSIQPNLNDDPLENKWQTGYGPSTDDEEPVSNGALLRWRADLMNSYEANDAARRWLWVAAVTGAVVAIAGGGAAYSLYPFASDDASAGTGE